MTRTTPPLGQGSLLLLASGAVLLVALRPGSGQPGPPSRATGEEPPQLGELADRWTREFFPGDPAALRDHPADPLTRHLAAGAGVFARYCAGCHGDAGDGQGAAAPFLVPRPRNFHFGVDADSPPLFKFRSTASGEAPLREDLERTVREGLPGSSMPAHRLVDAAEIRAVTDYVLWIARSREFRQAVRLAFDEEEPDLADAQEIASFHADFVLPEAERIRARYERPRVLSVSAEPPASPASIEAGRATYRRLGCHECHGAEGRGDGSSAATLMDNWGFPVDPRDFTTGRFRAGSSARDLYLRIKGGVAGTPMPAYEDLADEEAWALVHFIQSMAVERD